MRSTSGDRLADLLAFPKKKSQRIRHNLLSYISYLLEVARVSYNTLLNCDHSNE